MKFQWYKKLICYVFIAILFASGMHVEIDNSHFFLACESQTTAENQQYTSSQTFISSDYCTSELLQPRNTQYLKNNSAKRATIRRMRSFSPTSTLCNVKQNLFYFEEQQLSDVQCSASSQIVIIEYIHRQDGAK